MVAPRQCKGRLAAVALLLAAAAVGGSPPTAAAEADDGIYADLLARHVKQGVVSYAGFKADETLLDRYLGILEKVDPEALDREEQFAFYINAYNAWTIKLVLTGYPGLTSIKDLGSFFQSPWKKAFVRINGKTLTLDDIEHGILRPRFKDPRVHFAINCASKSCPPLLAEPFRGRTLDAQLDRVTRQFLNSPENHRLEGRTFWVSSIFKWFAEDFGDDVIGFYLNYADDGLKRRLEAGGGIDVSHLNYDWSLNGA